MNGGCLKEFLVNRKQEKILIYSIDETVGKSF